MVAPAPKIPAVPIGGEAKCPYCYRTFRILVKQFHVGFYVEPLPFRLHVPAVVRSVKASQDSKSAVPSEHSEKSVS